ncbi:hypothetical protein A0256_05065 [Mucilaginibacter sp. PAMC 26640]|nr:hypothetical protein A0256_05065 [Mucilaginibacter sp. PAMC 26640]
MRAVPKDVEEYFSWFPQQTQDAMSLVKATILNAIPDAKESISYAMPTYRYRGLLAHFAAYDKHIGFYPGALAVEVFAKDIAGFKSAKGSIQFPLNQPMPLDLIKRIIAFRLKENTSAVKITSK